MSEQVKERPILFSAEMVRALLDARKTQTRRVIKCPPSTGAFALLGMADGCWWPVKSLDGESIDDGNGCEVFLNCPYGKPGDRLWVRETWYDDLCPRASGDHSLTTTYGSGTEAWESPCVYYRADGEPDFEGARTPWRASIHMPRWASRILLEITDVRVQLLQEISVEEALSEGIRHSTMACPRMEFAQFWNSLHGETAWDLNPWVWALTFRVISG